MRPAFTTLIMREKDFLENAALFLLLFKWPQSQHEFACGNITFFSSHLEASEHTRGRVKNLIYNAFEIPSDVWAK